VVSVWMYERQHTGQIMSQVKAAFRERFNKAPHEERQCWIGKNEGSLLEVLSWLRCCDKIYMYISVHGNFFCMDLGKRDCAVILFD
jgi:hypothetical protein